MDDEEEGEEKMGEEGESKPITRSGKRKVDREKGDMGEGGEAGEAGEDDEPPPPPPPEQEKELLFLIEFMVDTLTVIPGNMNIENIDPCALQGPTSLTLTFLHFPPMYLSEKDMDPDKQTGSNEIKFNAGKSLMFALTESQFEEPPPVYLAITAFREMPHAFRIPRVAIGKTKIQLSELFKQVFDKYDENPDKTVSKSVKDKYELVGEKGKPAGDVTLYVRLTCMGENIVTEFQKAEELEDTVLFKNKESRKVYECVEKEKPEENLAMTLPGWGDEKMKKPCDGDPKAKLSPSAPGPDLDYENFEEIFAEINGSAIIVKVEKSKRKKKPKEFHISDFCDCNIPLPQDLVSGMSDLSMSPASEGSLNLGSGDPGKIDKRVGLDSANQLVFTVPPVETLSLPGTQNSVTYNVKTCNEGEKHGHKGKSSFRIVTDNNPDGPPPKMPNDPEKDVFVLRIFKKAKSDKGKDVLELEFKTPKEKIEPPPKPPYMIEKGAGPEKTKKEKEKKKQF